MSAEFFVVYDIESGAERWRGQGAPGIAAQQQPGEGRAVMVVPEAAIVGDTIDLEPIRASLRARVDAEAERVRCMYVTPGSGQAMEYEAVKAELLHYDAVIAAEGDPRPEDYPFVAADAAARGLSLAASFDEVRAARDAWAVAGSRIRAARLAAKAAIAAAATLSALAAASAIDWQSVLQPEE